MHYAGHMCDMKKIREIGKKNKIMIIEDAAQAFGAALNNKVAGSFSIVAGLSMNPMKALGGYGEAGVAVTSRKKIYEQLKILRHAGTTSDPKKIITNNCLAISLNHKMDTINAALLLVSLKNYKKKYTIKKRIAEIYDKEIPNNIKRQALLPKEKHGRYVYVIQIDKRNKLKKFLSKRGIETKIFHEPLACDAPIYKKFCKSRVPNARKILKNSLVIPSHEKLSKKQVYYVIKSIKDFLLKEKK